MLPCGSVARVVFAREENEEGAKMHAARTTRASSSMPTPAHAANFALLLSATALLLVIYHISASSAHSGGTLRVKAAAELKSMPRHSLEAPSLKDADSAALAEGRVVVSEPMRDARGASPSPRGASQLPRGASPLPRCLSAGAAPEILIEESTVHSQSGQDGTIASVFSAIGTTNRFYVEFGFNSGEWLGASGPNTYLLHENGWTGLLLDGGHSNAAINLHKHWLTPDNIAGLFDRYNVPRDLDYLSVDMDSKDLWMLRELLLAGYRPRLVSIEYNANFRFDSCVTQAWWAGHYTRSVSASAAARARANAGLVPSHARAYRG